MSKKILVTLGPSSLNGDVVKRCAAYGVYLFRINLSHTRIEDVVSTIQKIRSWTNIPICLDSEGAQLRNQDMVNERVYFKQGERVKIHFVPVCGDSNNISFTPNQITRQFLAGDEIRIDFDHVLLRVDSIGDNYAMATVVQAGTVGSNKASDIGRALHFEAITKKDKQAIAIGLENGVTNFALSFTNCRKDVDQMRALCGNDANIICKIESRLALTNLVEILEAADEILIDRGDLSRQVPIAKVPFLQRRIISIARSRQKLVFVATNLLESMVTKKSPTRAEVNDVVSTLLMGASGLVLAAETAIGNYPVEAVDMIATLVEETEKWTEETNLVEMIDN